MKKILFSFLVVLFLVSCSSDDTSDTIKKEGMDKETFYNKVKERYKMDDISVFDNSRSNLNIGGDSNEFTENKDFNVSEKYASNISEKGYRFLKDNKEIYAYRFNDYQNKFYIVDREGKYLILDFNVNEEGNGDIKFLFENGDLKIKKFGNGNLITINDNNIFSDNDFGIKSDVNLSNIDVTDFTSKAKNKFRTCFDAAYDSVCDGFIGCVSWYLTPVIPVTAAVYCEFFN